MNIQNQKHIKSPITKFELFIFVISILSILAALLLFCTNSYAANKTDPFTHYLKAPLMLTGSEGSGSFAINIEDNIAPDSSVEFLLSWKISQLINKKTSALTIIVDGQPVKTMWLSHLDALSTNGKFIVKLGTIKPGMHVVKLEAHLRIDDDPCLDKYRKQAWFSILGDSEITWKTLTNYHSKKGLKNIRAIWKKEQFKGSVTVIAPKKISPQNARAVIAVDHMLRNWNLKAIDSSLKDNYETNLYSKATIELKVVPKWKENNSSKMEQHHLILKQAPKETRSIIKSEGAHVTIISKTQEDLVNAIHQINNDKTREMCGESSICLLGPTENVQSSYDKKDKNSVDDLTVLTLLDIGYKTGWVAKGNGKHTLRFIWNKPALWKIDKLPILQLNARLPSNMLSKNQNSTITISLNERPLDTWKISDIKKDLNSDSTNAVTLKTKLPSSAFKESVWAFEIVVSLQGPQDQPCQLQNPLNTWIVIEESTNLKVERSEYNYAGISDFFNRSKLFTPKILWTKFKSWSEVYETSMLIYPFFKGSNKNRWNWTMKISDKHSLYIVPQNSLTPNNSSKLKLINEQLESSWWLNRDGELKVPIFDAQKTTWVEYKLNKDKHLLKLHIGLMSKWMDNPLPDYSAMPGRHAIMQEGKWHVMGQDATPLKVEEVTFRNSSIANINKANEHKRIKSISEQRLKWVNIIWAGILLSIIILLIVYWIRKPKNSGIVGTNIEVNNGKNSDT